MLAKKNVQKNFSDLENNQVEDDMILTEAESVHFKDEINKQLAETKIIDIGKAMRNARYLTKLDEALADNDEKTFTFEELESYMNEIRKI